MSKPSFSRRQFLAASGASLASSAAAGSGAASSADEKKPKGGRPNIILFMPDELRADAVACFGNPVVRTPNMDRLASEGTRFANCSVQYPVCGASRCSLLTGWPTSVRGHRSLFYFLRPEEPNLFRYLKQSGYDVFWFGKNDALAAQSFCGSVTYWNQPTILALLSAAAARGAPRSALSPPWPFGDPHYYSFLRNEGGDRRQTGDYHQVSSAIRVLERSSGERPFCIFLPLISPHPPYTAPQGFHDLYNPASLPPLRPMGLARKPNFHAGIREAYNLLPLTEADFRKIRAVYLGMVSYTDWLLGELMEAVERTHHADDTAIFVLSDHGDYGGDYGLVEKWPSGLEDNLTHIPLIARVPDGVPGHTCASIVELFDVMATCLELADVEAQHTHFARSLMPQIHGGTGDPDRAAFAEGGYNIYEPQCFEDNITNPREIYYPKEHLEVTHPEMISRAAMVRTPTHKLILRPSGQSELYAYKDDPNELHNLYGDAAVATLQCELERRLAVWYLNTTGIAPFDKDQRGLPPFYPTIEFSKENWHRKLLDLG